MQHSTKQPLPALTGLRFFAAFAVLISHSTFFITFPPFLDLFLKQGWLGVPLFFVLSGFILTYNYADWFARGVSLERLHAFALARIARIAPLYVVAHILITPVILVLITIYPETLANRYHTAITPQLIATSWLANLLPIQIYIPDLAQQRFWNSPSWSVSVECVFYAFFPFVIGQVARIVKIRALILFITYCLIIETLLFFGTALLLSPLTIYAGLILYVAPYLHIWEFLIGCAAARIFHAGPLSSRTRTAMFGASLFMLLMMATVPQAVFGDAGEIYNMAAIIWAAPLFAAMILALASGPVFLSKLLIARRVVLLGESSYALYLTHWIPLVVLTIQAEVGVDIPPLLAIAITLSTIPASVAFYYWIEVPARRAIRAGTWWPKRPLPVIK